VREASALKTDVDVVKAFRRHIAKDPREHFVAIYLDSKHYPIGIHTVSIGTVNGTMVGPREVFAPAVALYAAAVIVAHNHPSGDPAPSSEDRLVTERLKEAGELLGIELLDHVILGSKGHYSFAEGR
jgi:DNA repair protein RadC